MRLLLLFRNHAVPFVTLFVLEVLFVILQLTALLNAKTGLAMIISLILHPISNVP